MQFASSLPITAFSEITAVSDYARALEDAGFDYAVTSGHVLGQPAGSHPNRPEPLYVGPFYDPFVTFSYLAAVTQRLRFVTGILILPALPTVLVAKQAAELALFSRGRFELGVGLSWNQAEYEALGQNIHDRGRRIEEQVEVLRLLWSQPFVTFDGKWHKLDKVGLNRPNLPAIPIWFGSESGETALRRVARLADGWMSLGDPTTDLPTVHRFMREAGRDLKTLRVRGPLTADDSGEAGWVAGGQRLQAAGVSVIHISAPGGLPTAEALARMIRMRRVLSDALG